MRKKIQNYFESESGIEIPVFVTDIDRTRNRELERKTSRVRSISRLDGWSVLRKIVLDRYGRVCMRCGSEDKIQVDHIFPRNTHPELSLEINNLQILCKSCNSKKGNKDSTDYRNN